MPSMRLLRLARHTLPARGHGEEWIDEAIAFLQRLFGELVFAPQGARAQGRPSQLFSLVPVESQGVRRLTTEGLLQENDGVIPDDAVGA